MDNKTIKILETIDSNPKPLLDKEKLLNLLELTKQNNINLFDDKKGKIKSKRKIIQECKESRTSKIENFVRVLDDKKKNKSNNKIKILNDNFMKELESIENIVKYVNDNEFKVLKDLSDTKENCESKKEINKNHKEEEYIEIFSNE